MSTTPATPATPGSSSYVYDRWAYSGGPSCEEVRRAAEPPRGAIGIMGSRGESHEKWRKTLGKPWENGKNM